MADARRAAHPWLVTAVVITAATLEFTLLTISSTATRYIVGGLGGTPTNGFWVSNAYMAAVAVMIPIAAWFSDRLGRRRFMLLSLAGFAGFSTLCGLATGMYELILWRVLQGIAGGGLQPLAQAVILDTFPSNRRAVPLAVFGTCTLGGIFFGPFVGGLLTDNLSWRWTFLVVVPPAVLTLVGMVLWVKDPPELQARRAALLSRPIRFDYPGLVFLVVGIVGLQVFLGKGQEWDWFGDPFYRVQACFAAAVVGLGLMIRRELRAAEPLVDFRPLADRHFTACAVTIFIGYGLFYGSSGALGTLLFGLFGYDASKVGLVEAPAGVAALPFLFASLWWIGRGYDGRLLILIGTGILVGGCYWMSQMNLAISPAEVATPRTVQVLGLVLILVPLMSIAYQTVAPELIGAATGLFSFFRFTGGTIGTALGDTLLARREQFHSQRLGEGWDALNPKLRDAHDELQADFYRLTGDPAAADAMAWDWLNNLRNGQAESLAAFDIYWVAMIVSVTLVGLVLLMRGPPRNTA